MGDMIMRDYESTKVRLPHPDVHLLQFNSLNKLREYVLLGRLCIRDYTLYNFKYVMPLLFTRLPAYSPCMVRRFDNHVYYFIPTQS